MKGSVLRIFLIIVSTYTINCQPPQEEYVPCRRKHEISGQCKPVDQCQQILDYGAQYQRHFFCGKKYGIKYFCCFDDNEDNREKIEYILIKTAGKKDENKKTVIPDNIPVSSIYVADLPDEAISQPFTFTKESEDRRINENGEESAEETAPLEKIPRRRPDNSAKSSEGRRISEIACDEYRRQIQSLGSCFESDSETVQEVQIGMYSHLVAIGDVDQNRVGTFVCHGSLISDTYVLTAAHCNNPGYGSPRIVRVGDVASKLTSKEILYIDTEIEAFIAHPEYSTEEYSIYDIALIRLYEAPRLYNRIRPACLFTGTDNNLEFADSISWKANDLSVVTKVKKTVETKQCNVRPDQICTKNDQIGQCQVSNGGPLQLQDEEDTCLHHIVGLSVYSADCGKPRMVAVYTRVSSYLDWIESVVWGSQ